MRTKHAMARARLAVCAGGADRPRNRCTSSPSSAASWPNRTRCAAATSAVCARVRAWALLTRTGGRSRACVGIGPQLYFHSLVLNMKMNSLHSGTSYSGKSNVDSQQLFEKCVQERVALADWPTFVSKHF